MGVGGPSAFLSPSPVCSRLLFFAVVALLAFGRLFSHFTGALYASGWERDLPSHPAPCILVLLARRTRLRKMLPSPSRTWTHGWRAGEVRGHSRPAPARHGWDASPGLWLTGLSPSDTFTDGGQAAPVTATYRAAPPPGHRPRALVPRPSRPRASCPGGGLCSRDSQRQRSSEASARRGSSGALGSERVRCGRFAAAPQCCARNPPKICPSALRGLLLGRPQRVVRATLLLEALGPKPRMRRGGCQGNRGDAAGGPVSRHFPRDCGKESLCGGPQHACARDYVCPGHVRVHAGPQQVCACSCVGVGGGHGCPHHVS